MWGVGAGPAPLLLLDFLSQSAVTQHMRMQPCVACGGLWLRQAWASLVQNQKHAVRACCAAIARTGVDPDTPVAETFAEMKVLVAAAGAPPSCCCGDGHALPTVSCRRPSALDMSDCPQAQCEHLPEASSVLGEAL